MKGLKWIIGQILQADITRVKSGDWAIGPGYNFYKIIIIIIITVVINIIIIIVMF